jgi:histone H4
LVVTQQQLNNLPDTKGCTMFGLGKGKSGLGKGKSGLAMDGTIRFRKTLKDNIQGITKPAVRRLARRGGVKRMQGKVLLDETRGILKVFLENVIRDTVTYTEHGKRKTVDPNDVVAALARQGRTLYGFGEFLSPKDIGGHNAESESKKQKEKRMKTLLNANAEAEAAAAAPSPRKVNGKRIREENYEDGAAQAAAQAAKKAAARAKIGKLLKKAGRKVIDAKRKAGLQSKLAAIAARAAPAPASAGTPKKKTGRPAGSAKKVTSAGSAKSNSSSGSSMKGRTTRSKKLAKEAAKAAEKAKTRKQKEAAAKKK